jgi:hypothetical protein
LIDRFGRVLRRFFHFRSCAASSCFGTAISRRIKSAVRAIESGGGGLVFMLSPFCRGEGRATSVQHVACLGVSLPVRAL